MYSSFFHALWLKHFCQHFSSLVSWEFNGWLYSVSIFFWILRFFPCGFLAFGFYCSMPPSPPFSFLAMSLSPLSLLLGLLVVASSLETLVSMILIHIVSLWILMVSYNVKA